MNSRPTSRPCRLPHDVFDLHGYELTRPAPNHHGNGRAFAAAMQDPDCIAHGHLCEIPTYTLAIPSEETGIRRFLIWAVFLAVSTLGKISNDPLFTLGTQVKVSRPRVAAIIAGSSTLIRSDDGLTKLFHSAARALPLTTENATPGQIRKESINP